MVENQGLLEVSNNSNLSNEDGKVKVWEEVSANESKIKS